MDPTFISLILSALNLILAIYVFEEDHRRRINQVFGLFLLVNAVAAFSFFVSMLMFDPYWANRLKISALIFVPAIIFHFSILFPDHKPKRVSQDYIKIFYITATILFFVAMGTSSFFAAFATDPPHTLTPGPIYFLLILWFIIPLVIAFVNLIHTRRSLKFGIEKDQLIYVATAVLVLLFTLPFVGWTGYGAFDILLASLLVTAVLIAYAVFRYRFLSVNPVIEKKYGKVSYPLEKGDSYVTAKTEKAYAIFANRVAVGAHGICFSPKSPSTVKKKTGLSRTPVIHLTKRHGGKTTFDPGQIEHISFTIVDFIEKADMPLIFLDGFEYMMHNNTFEDVLLFILYLKKKIHLLNGMLLISLDPKKVDEKQMKLIRRELIPID